MILVFNSNLRHAILRLVERSADAGLVSTDLLEADVGVLECDVLVQGELVDFQPLLWRLIAQVHAMRRVDYSGGHLQPLVLLLPLGLDMRRLNRVHAMADHGS